MENNVKIVQSAQPIVLTIGEALFVKSIIRALNNDGTLRFAAAESANMTEEQFNSELDALNQKIEVMAFPKREEIG